MSLWFVQQIKGKEVIGKGYSYSREECSVRQAGQQARRQLKREASRRWVGNAARKGCLIVEHVYYETSERGEARSKDIQLHGLQKPAPLHTGPSAVEACALLLSLFPKGNVFMYQIQI